MVSPATTDVRLVSSFFVGVLVAHAIWPVCTCCCGGVQPVPGSFLLVKAAGYRIRRRKKDLEVEDFVEVRPARNVKVNRLVLNFFYFRSRFAIFWY